MQEEACEFMSQKITLTAELLFGGVLRGNGGARQGGIRVGNRGVSPL